MRSKTRTSPGDVFNAEALEKIGHILGLEIARPTEAEMLDVMGDAQLVGPLIQGVIKKKMHENVQRLQQALKRRVEEGSAG